jgi:WD40 repeat protein/serine/threonine protein kinase
MSTDPTISLRTQVREIFLKALGKNPAERPIFLDEACGKNATLQRQVEELLAEEEKVGGFLETPVVAGVRSLAADAFTEQGTAILEGITEKPGQRIGRYKLLQNIGEGGCGVVYMAEQEEPVRRRVALKVIKLGMDTRSVIARFEAERQALALMDHPNIARVLDAGATETGRPFFVMELVRGVRITQYCDENNLTTEERLKLFIQVCNAIQHAHQKGVIHRDIKPSNILVTLHDSVPVPKVIDFGIAKATEQRLTEKTLFTAFTTFIGTPAYMSPEQAQMSGLDIDTRSDIYSLGVLLYELLIGKTPFDAEALLQSGLDECRRTIQEKEPARPSTRLATMVEADLTTTAKQRHTQAPKLIHLLRGDLDWIAMKCLEKDRTRRYASASDLAEDVQRYLAGEAVDARPPSNAYRLQKLIHRHRRAFAVAAALAAILVAGAGISTWQAVRATTAEHIAESSRKLEAGLRRHAQQATEAARLNEYVADINLAQQSLASGNYGRAVQLLNKHQPKPGEPDLRGFEWRYLWDRSRGDEHVAFAALDGPVQSIAVSPAGDLLAIGQKDKITIWNLRTKALLTTVPKGASSMVFLPGGRSLVSANGNFVRLWSTADGSEQRRFTNVSGPLALAKDGSKLALLLPRQFNPDYHQGLRILDTSNWSEKLIEQEASSPLAVSMDGKTVAAKTPAGITIWPAKGDAGEVVLENSTNVFPLRSPYPRSMAFSPDGKYVVAARNTLSERGVFVLNVWDASSGKEKGTIPDDPEHIEHIGAISMVAFSPDGHTLATASMDHSIRLWDFTTRQRVTILQGHLSEVLSLAFAPDGQSLVSGAKDGEVKIWPTHATTKEDAFPGMKQPLAFSKDGKTLAALSRDGVVTFLDLATREPERQFPLEKSRPRFGPLLVPAISQDLKTLVQALEDGSVKILNTVTGESTSLNVARRMFMEPLALSPDGQTLITGTHVGREPAFQRWSLKTGESTAWPVEAAKVFFSPDSGTIATYGRGNSIQFWNAATLLLQTNIVSEEQFAFPSSSSAIPAAFSPDGRIFAVACQDDAIRLWEVGSGKLLGTCIGHKQGLFSIAFSPDGKTLASDSDDSTLKLWNVATQQELLTIRRLGGALRALIFSRDGQLLVGGTSSTNPAGGLHFYHAPFLASTGASAVGGQISGQTK